jgi:hypothetical protein
VRGTGYGAPCRSPRGNSRGRRSASDAGRSRGPDSAMCLSLAQDVGAPTGYSAKPVEESVRLGEGRTTIPPHPRCLFICLKAIPMNDTVILHCHCLPFLSDPHSQAAIAVTFCQKDPCERQRTATCDDSRVAPLHRQPRDEGLASASREIETS